MEWSLVCVSVCVQPSSLFNLLLNIGIFPILLLQTRLKYILYICFCLWANKSLEYISRGAVASQRESTDVTLKAIVSFPDWICSIFIFPKRARPWLLRPTALLTMCWHTLIFVHLRVKTSFSVPCLLFWLKLNPFLYIYGYWYSLFYKLSMSLGLVFHWLICSSRFLEVVYLLG